MLLPWRSGWFFGSHALLLGLVGHASLALDEAFNVVMLDIQNVDCDLLEGGWRWLLGVVVG